MDIILLSTLIGREEPILSECIAKQTAQKGMLLSMWIHLEWEYNTRSCEMYVYSGADSPAPEGTLSEKKGVLPCVCLCSTRV